MGNKSTLPILKFVPQDRTKIKVDFEKRIRTLFDYMPVDVLCQIFKYISDAELGRISRTSKSLYILSSKDELWKERTKDLTTQSTYEEGLKDWYIHHTSFLIPKPFDSVIHRSLPLLNIRVCSAVVGDIDEGK